MYKRVASFVFQPAANAFPQVVATATPRDMSNCRDGPVAGCEHLPAVAWWEWLTSAARCCSGGGQLNKLLDHSKRKYLWWGRQVKLVLQHNRFFVESPDSRILEEMLRDPIIRAARVLDGPGAPSEFQARSSPTPIFILAAHCTLAESAHVLCPHAHQL